MAPPPPRVVMEPVTRLTKKQRTVQAIVFTILGMASTVVLVWIISNAEVFAASSFFSADKNGSSEFHVRTVQHNHSNTAAARCSSICAKQVRAAGAATTKTKTQNNSNTKDAAELLNRQTLLDRARTAQAVVVEKLRRDYGAYFEPMFVDTTVQTDTTGEVTYRPVHPITPAGPSLARLKRKLMLKLLQMQVTVQNAARSTTTTTTTTTEGCECTTARGTPQRGLPEEELESAEPETTRTNPTTTYAQYIWATGGHSAAAGHGNLYNESYTAYMERDLVDVFASVGLEFIGRNYAMGGTAAGPEISMCWQEIFGTDVDFVSWDYGMTDGNAIAKMLHYLYRGGISPGRPALLCFHGGGRSRSAREAATKQFEEMGFAAFYGKTDDFTAMNTGIPDSAALSVAEVAQLPPYVQNYKCGTSIEKGDPDCGANKYTSYLCPKRSAQTSWHPGFKEHAKDGHGLALFMMNALIGTLQDLVDHPVDDVDTLLLQLQKEEDEAFANITKAALPDNYGGILNFETLLNGTSPSSLYDLVYKAPSMCHTGKLPSQIRYLGYLNDDTTKIGRPAPFKMEEYDVGINLANSDEITAFRRNTIGNNSITMPLVYETGKKREECGGDVVIVKPDYPDFFYTPYDNTIVDDDASSWTTMMFPNKAEQNAYYGGNDVTKYKGLLFVHLQKCDWNKCHRNDLKIDDYGETNKWVMRINNVRVSSLVTIDDHKTAYAAIAKNDDGIYFTPDSNGQYKIEIKVNEQGGYVRISSFVLY